MQQQNNTHGKMAPKEWAMNFTWRGQRNLHPRDTALTGSYRMNKNLLGIWKERKEHTVQKGERMYQVQ